MRKKREYLQLYADRVKEEVAKDYRVVVAQEMWFNLIKERLTRNFYRTNAQLMRDLDQIKMNAVQYNGKNHDIAEDAIALVDDFKSGMLKLFDEMGQG